MFAPAKKKKIVVLLGHPDIETLTGSLALLYEQSAQAAGHEVRRFNLGEMRFDPILHKGYKVIQELEPDLKNLQEALKWCDHFVIFYPNWWCTMPALLKGLFDRMWLPGFCFGFYKEGIMGHFNFWKRYMRGKTARVFVLSGTHPVLIWLLFGDYTNEIKNGILWFVGFKPKITRFGPTEKAPEWLKNNWRRTVIRLGRKGE
jgi:putative NADPH-quinone reductase